MLALTRTAANRVVNELGPGHRECVYARAIACELRARALHVCIEHPVTVTYTASDGFSTAVGAERADIFLDSKAVIEVKLAECITPAAVAQARRYARSLSVGVAIVVAISRDGGINLAEVTE